MKVHMKSIVFSCCLFGPYILLGIDAIKFDLSYGLTPDKFGPIVLNTQIFSLCKGPKRRECAVTLLKSTGDNFEVVEFTQKYAKNAEFMKVKIAVFINDTSSNFTSATPDFVKSINHPCQHFLLGSFLKTHYNASPNKCSVFKGFYTIRFNATALFYSIFGGKFFYGTYRTHSTVLGKDCNVVCVINQYVLQKPQLSKPTN